MTQVSGEKTIDTTLAVKKTASLNLAGSKLRKQLSSSLQEHVSAPTSEFAVQQLQKMGWTEGTGLGKRRNGIKTHIKVVRRQESAGLGTEKEAAEVRAATESWWKDGLNDTLAKLSCQGKKKKQKRKRKEYTDEELFEATGGARFGMRAGKTRNLAKWRRTESEPDDSAKSSDDEEKKCSSENADTVNERPIKNKKKKRKITKSIEETGGDEPETSEKKEKKKKSRKGKKAKKKKRGSDLD